MAVNKVIFGNETVIDLTNDDVQASDVASGKKFHLPNGEETIGTNTFDADTKDADALAGDIIDTKIAYVKGTKVVGTMPNNGAVTGTIDNKATPYKIPAGYHDGTGEVNIDDVEKDKIIPQNIKEGVSILGVVGSYAPTEVTAQAKSATPYTTAQTVLPDVGYDYLSQVEIAPIKYQETPNSANGITVTIGDVKPN